MTNKQKAAELVKDAIPRCGLNDYNDECPRYRVWVGDVVLRAMRKPELYEKVLEYLNRQNPV